MGSVTRGVVFRRLGFDPDLVDYAHALVLQRQLHADVLAGRQPSTVLLLEHEDVYTAGRRTKVEDLPRDGTPVVDVDRGGEVTWHGRGQLVVYPILRLRDRSLVRDYVSSLEHMLMNVLSEDFGIESTRVEGHSGVWLTDRSRDRKIAAIGLRVHKTVTMHGFALNCSNDLAPFENIVACGIDDADTTTISAELGRLVSPADIAERVIEEMSVMLPRFLNEAENAVTGSGPVSSTPPVDAR